MLSLRETSCLENKTQFGLSLPDLHAQGNGYEAT